MQFSAPSRPHEVAVMVELPDAEYRQLYRFWYNHWSHTLALSHYENQQRTHIGGDWWTAQQWDAFSSNRGDMARELITVPVDVKRLAIRTFTASIHTEEA